MARAFPKTLNWIGLIVAVMSLWLAGRLVWEQTVWTWVVGHKMSAFP
jgi:hypothetical protein